MSRNSTHLSANPFTHPVGLILFFNCLVYLLQIFDTHHQLIFHFGLIPARVIEEGQIWQVFTYGFLHSPGGILPFHLIFNMYAFFMLSSILIPTLGKWKLTFLYFLSQLGGGILVILFAWLNQVFFDGNLIVFDSWMDPTIGASGAVFGLLAVFGMLFPEMEIFLLFIRVQAKNAVWISLFIGYGLVLLLDARISNTGHLGGAFSGFLFYHFFLRQERVSPKLPNPFRIQRRKWNQNSQLASTSIEDVFAVQQKINQEILARLERMNSMERIAYLKQIQVPDANICPPIAYNPEDPICFRCDWLANCALRKEKSTL